MAEDNKLDKKEILDEKEDKSKSDEMDTIVEREQKKVTDNVNSLLKKLEGVSQLPEAENYLLSYRHQYVERLAVYKKIKNQVRAEIKKARRDLIAFYRLGGQNIKLSSTEMKDFIESDVRFKSKLVETVEAQINFLERTIETLDKMSFVIKNKYAFQQHV